MLAGCVCVCLCLCVCVCVCLCVYCVCVCVCLRTCVSVCMFLRVFVGSPEYQPLKKTYSMWDAVNANQWMRCHFAGYAITFD